MWEINDAERSRAMSNNVEIEMGAVPNEVGRLAAIPNTVGIHMLTPTNVERHSYTT